MRINNFSDLEEFLLRALPKKKSSPPGPFELKRAKAFLQFLGNPQEKIQVIHIAGTSGKGSTAYLISQLLQSHGYSAGLSLSPHFLDIRERCQVNAQLLPKKKFLAYANEIVPAVHKIQESKYGTPTYFEFFIALAFYVFWKEKVDYAVIETGLGGLFDATNVVRARNKICVVTRIGKDHTRILGRTLNNIATHKVGIIHKDQHTIALWQKRQVNEILERKKSVDFVQKGRDFSIECVSEKETFFHFGVWKNLCVGLAGEFQAENASLALASFLYLAKRDHLSVQETKVRSALRKAHFPGRFEIFNRNRKKIIIDGAHNPQKVSALVQTLTRLYPKQKFDFLVAHKSKKDYKRMLKKILPIAHHCILTSLSVSEYHQLFFYRRKEEMKNIFSPADYKKCIFIANQEQAFSVALAGENTVIITGSLYFVADVYTKIKNQK